MWSIFAFRPFQREITRFRLGLDRFGQRPGQLTDGLLLSRDLGYQIQMPVWRIGIRFLHLSSGRSCYNEYTMGVKRLVVVYLGIFW